MVVLAALDWCNKLVLIGFFLCAAIYLWPVIWSLVVRAHAALVSDPAPEACRAPAVVEKELRGLGDVLAPIRRSYKLPALAAAAVRGGRVVALGAVGVRRAGHAEPVQAGDRFHIGSCTKAMTATLCGLLVERGKFSWDSTVAEVFPDLAPELAEGYRPVTLEQLLTHRSGLAEGIDFNSKVWPKVCDLSGPLPDQRLALLRLVFGSAPDAAPGSTYQYSNCGYAIAGAMCERVTGRAWEDLMREMLFEPLGMTTAGFGPPGTPGQADQPWGHQLGFFRRRWQALPPGEKDSDNPLVIASAGCVHCSLADWAKFVLLHLGGPHGSGPLLRPDTVRLLQSPTLGGDYAFGWTVTERDWAGGKALTHSGSNTLWYCVVWLAPNRGLGVLAATNLGTDAAVMACDKAVERVLDVLGPGVV
jgi:CubicO group peptidase (beta-lactamase class C family)